MRSDATSTPMKLKRAMRHAIELDDDVVEAIFLHVMSVEEVGRLSQASIQFRRVAATAMVQAWWALRIRMMKHATGMCQPDLVSMDDKMHPHQLPAAAMSEVAGRLFTSHRSIDHKQWLTAWKVTPGSLPTREHRTQIRGEYSAGAVITPDDQRLVLSSWRGGAQTRSVARPTARPGAVVTSSMKGCDKNIQHTAMAIHRDHILCSANWEGTLYTHDLRDGRLMDMIDLPSGRCNSMATDGQGRLFCACDYALLALRVRDAGTITAKGDHNFNLLAHTGGYGARAVIIHNGKLFAVCSSHQDPRRYTLLLGWELPQYSTDAPDFLFSIDLEFRDATQLAVLDDLLFVGGSERPTPSTWSTRIVVYELRRHLWREEWRRSEPFDGRSKWRLDPRHREVDALRRSGRYRGPALLGRVPVAVSPNDIRHRVSMLCPAAGHLLVMSVQDSSDQAGVMLVY